MNSLDCLIDLPLLATDAMADMSPQAHENSVLRIFPRLGEAGTTDEILSLLGSVRD